MNMLFPPSSGSRVLTISYSHDWQNIEILRSVAVYTVFYFLCEDLCEILLEKLLNFYSLGLGESLGRVKGYSKDGK